MVSYFISFLVSCKFISFILNNHLYVIFWYLTFLSCFCFTNFLWRTSVFYLFTYLFISTTPYYTFTYKVKKNNYKSSEGNSKKNYKNDKIVITKNYGNTLKHKEKKIDNEERPKGLTEAAFVVKRKECKSMQTGLSGVYGRGGAKREF